MLLEKNLVTNRYLTHLDCWRFVHLATVKTVCHSYFGFLAIRKLVSVNHNGLGTRRSWGSIWRWVKTIGWWAQWDRVEVIGHGDPMLRQRVGGGGVDVTVLCID